MNISHFIPTFVCILCIVGEMAQVKAARTPILHLGKAWGYILIHYHNKNITARFPVLFLNNYWNI